MKKRLLSTLLALCMALSLLPGTAQAALISYPVTGGIIEFDGATGEITGHFGEVTEAIIPDEINGVPVTSIGDAFNGCSSLTNVTIPNSVTSIGHLAFAGCSMTSITIPNSVTSIGSFAFMWCNSLTSITIPNSVTSIERGTFYECINLTSVTIPSSVISIDYEAFAGCSSLTTVTVPGSVTSTGRATFYECSGLTSATILSSVTRIDYETFAGCNSLTSVTIPSSVTHIETGAFYNCTSLTDVYYSGSEPQWNQIRIDGRNDLLTNATIHYNSTGPDQGNSTPQESSTPSTDEYIYGTTDLGEGVWLDAERLNRVTDSVSAAEAVRDMVSGMTQEQRESATGIDLATLYAETAVAKVASQPVTGSDILINATAVANLGTEAAQTSNAVENPLANGGITTARELSKTVTFTTNVSSQITIRIDPDILGTEVDKVRVEAPDYALTFKLSDLAPDLTGSLTFKAAPANAETLSVKNAVDIEVPGGSMAAPITVSLPTDKSTDTAYQAVVSSTGTTAASKYNPATTDIDSKVNASGRYSVETNEMDFTDITDKSTEMQKAIKYLASHGIVMGSGGTNYSPNDSISRAELTALVLRALGKVDSKATTSFTDVTPANWYYATAASSQKLGYITGFEDNTFRGTTTINKEQIVVVAARVLGGEMNYKTPSNTAAYLSKYSDTVVSWAQPQVALATRENLVVYRTDGTFSGAKNMTRGDAAIIIYRLFQRIW